MSGNIIILSGPSRGGKDTVVTELQRLFSRTLEPITTYTTRPQRVDEVEGTHHFFVDKKTFRTMIRRGAFLEWAHVRSNYFGTPKKRVEEALANGRSVLLKIDVQGMAVVKKQFPRQSVTIFLKPGSFNDIRERLQTSGFTRTQQRVRLKEARRELRAARYYDYIIINKKGCLDKTVAQAVALFKRILRRKR